MPTYKDFEIKVSEEFDGWRYIVSRGDWPWFHGEGFSDAETAEWAAEVEIDEFWPETEGLNDEGVPYDAMLDDL